MPPRERIEDENLPGEDSEEEAELTVVEITRDGHVIYFDLIDVNDVNFTTELNDAILSIPLYVDYIACINCCFPLTTLSDIESTIWAVHHSHIPIAYAIPLHSRSLICGYALIENFNEIHWKTVAHCWNCSILLTIPALTIFNIQIDEYTNDCHTLILDAASVMFCRREVR